MIIKIHNGIIKITSQPICQYVLASYLQSGHELLVAHERRVGDPWCNLLTLCSDAGDVFKTSQSLNRWPMSYLPVRVYKLVGHASWQGRTGHRENRENSRWPGSQFGPLPCNFIFFIIYYYYFILLLLFLLPTECTKVIISEFAIQ